VVLPVTASGVRHLSFLLPRFIPVLCGGGRRAELSAAKLSAGARGGGAERGPQAPGPSSSSSLAG